MKKLNSIKKVCCNDCKYCSQIYSILFCDYEERSPYNDRLLVSGSTRYNDYGSCKYFQLKKEKPNLFEKLINRIIGVKNEKN